MNAIEFEKIVDEQVKRSVDILVVKAKEYASEEDRLHNFKQAASIQVTTPINACAGIMVKHTVSVFDMCRADKTYSLDMWNEKITDSINYLLLLRALVEEASQK